MQVAAQERPDRATMAVEAADHLRLRTTDRQLLRQVGLVVATVWGPE
jgi:hypothetical protein